MRTPKEREGDLDSQIGACRVGEQRMLQLAEKYGEEKLQALIEELLDYSERLVRAELRSDAGGEFQRRRLAGRRWRDRYADARLRCGCEFDPRGGHYGRRFCRLVRRRLRAA